MIVVSICSLFYDSFFECVGSVKGLNILKMDMVHMLSTDQSVLHDQVTDDFVL